MWIDTPPDDAPARPHRIGVFLDYWYAYTTARQLFAPPQAPPPPAWFGNVPPTELAHHLVKRPPSHARRSERVLTGTHVFVRHVDPVLHPAQSARVRRWEDAGVVVHIGPSRDESPGHWQGTINVDLACTVTHMLDLASYDTAIVFAGDAALSPLFRLLSWQPDRLELATWVADDGSAPNGLDAIIPSWCHRLGHKTFRALIDDRGSAIGKERARSRRERQVGGAAIEAPAASQSTEGEPGANA